MSCKQWEIREINDIMNHTIEGWEPGTTKRIPGYGVQRTWRRKAGMELEQWETTPHPSKQRVNKPINNFPILSAPKSRESPTFSLYILILFLMIKKCKQRIAKQEKGVWKAPRSLAGGFLMPVYIARLQARQHKLPSRIRGFGKQQRCFLIPMENAL